MCIWIFSCCCSGTGNSGSASETISRGSSSILDEIDDLDGFAPDTPPQVYGLLAAECSSENELHTDESRMCHWVINESPRFQWECQDRPRTSVRWSEYGITRGSGSQIFGLVDSPRSVCSGGGKWWLKVCSMCWGLSEVFGRNGNSFIHESHRLQLWQCKLKNPSACNVAQVGVGCSFLWGILPVSGSAAIAATDECWRVLMKLLFREKIKRRSIASATVAATGALTLQGLSSLILWQLQRGGGNGDIFLHRWGLGLSVLSQSGRLCRDDQHTVWHFFTGAV